MHAIDPLGDKPDLLLGRQPDRRQLVYSTPTYAVQSTQGNLFFTATIRIDVVQASFPHRLQAPPPMLSQPPLNNRGTLIWQDHGTSKYDTA